MRKPITIIMDDASLEALNNIRASRMVREKRNVSYAEIIRNLLIEAAKTDGTMATPN